MIIWLNVLLSTDIYCTLDRLKKKVRGDRLGGWCVVDWWTTKSAGETKSRKESFSACDIYAKVVFKNIKKLCLRSSVQKKVYLI